MSPHRPHDLPDRLRAALGPVVEGAGLYLEDVSVAPAGRRTVVRVVVDLPDGPGGVDSDALSAVSRSISGVLDDVDLVEGAYTLEVSTPGAERRLVEARHFRRAVGRLVVLRTGAGGTTGRLVAVEGGDLVLESDGRRSTVPLGQVADARVELELNRPEQA